MPRIILLVDDDRNLLHALVRNLRHPDYTIFTAGSALEAQQILGPSQFSDACLRVTGHPQLLRMAEALNGADMTPFHEALWVKQAHLGGSVAWQRAADVMAPGR